ncbi:hypothetical protein Ga0100231_004565 [Opitutaceae bacterium TAV4]|nr:hypothetical protein Ga0100231_004565 [Opitutaceae bacterium TAV4]RRK02284.1 hypothetical protein Ga0100230_003730 [Opitutaceae bacterium TAV3]
MKRRRRKITTNKRLIAIAGLFVAATLIEVFVIAPRLGDNSPAIGIWRSVLTLLLAVGLALGRNLTRFVVAGVAALAGIWGIIHTSYQMLAASTASTFSLQVFLWMFFLSIGYLLIAWHLTYSDAIKREFRRSAHWQRKRA